MSRFHRFALLAFVFLAGCSSTFEKDLAFSIKPQSFTFIHISDPHVGVEGHAETDAAMFKEMSQLKPQPKFVVATGDICEIGGDEEYAQWRETLASLGDVKMYVAPGNHDVRWNPRGKEGYTRGVQGPLYQSWDFGGVHFVTLDSTVLLEHWGHISQEQLDWLKKDLEKVGKERPVVIGFHHWIGRESVMVDNEQTLIDLVAPYNVVLWLQGHGHNDIDWNINGAPATMVAGLYQGSYNIIEVTPTEMKIRKRKIAKPKKGSEMIREAATAPAEPTSVVEDVMTIPLKKQPQVAWSADAKIATDRIEVTAGSSELPGDAKVECRIDGGKYEEMSRGRHVWHGKIPTTQMVPGEHEVTVQLTIGKRAYQKPIPVTLEGAVKPIWETNVGGAVQSWLSRDLDMLFVATMGNDFVALDASNGHERWRVKTGGPIFSMGQIVRSSSTGEGTIFFGSADHYVYAIDEKSGHQKWKSETGGAVLAGPAYAKGVVCVGTTDTKIYGLNARDGSIKWTVPGKNMYQARTGTDGERFFVGGWDNMFRCIDAASGNELWAKRLGKSARSDVFSAYAPAITTPAVGNGRVYISTNDGVLHALNISDGSEVWRVDWKRMGYSSPLHVDGKVFAALSDEGKVFRVNANPQTSAATTLPTTGPSKDPVPVNLAELAWQAETGSVIYDSSFAYGGGGYVYIGSVSGVLSAFDAGTGRRVWQYRLGTGHLLGSPVADDERVYMGSMSGKVVALPAKPKND